MNGLATTIIVVAAPVLVISLIVFCVRGCISTIDENAAEGAAERAKFYEDKNKLPGEAKTWIKDCAYHEPVYYCTDRAVDMYRDGLFK